MSDAAGESFEADIRRWVVSALADGVAHFDELLALLPGVYPPLVLRTIRALAREGRVSSRRLAAFELDAGQPAVRREVGALPPPHALEFEWRFDRATAALLWQEAAHLTPAGGRVMLLGTPTVALAALAGRSQRRAIFVGEANAVTDSVEAVTSAARRNVTVETCESSSLGAEAVATIVIDPPWYPDFIRPMMRLAASACEVGGTILISMPPIGTRPGIIDERRRLISYFRRLRLQLVELRTGTLRYETPFFESNALAADGLTGIRADWRRSDLFILRKTGPVPTVTFANLARVREWEQFQVGRMRVFLRQPPVAGRGEGETIQSLVDGDIFGSVSRRSPERKRVAIWTSGNRVFGSSRRDLVSTALRAVGGLHNSEDFRFRPREDRDEVDRLCYLFARLAALEEAEERDGRSGDDRWHYQRHPWTSARLRLSSRGTSSGTIMLNRRSRTLAQ